MAYLLPLITNLMKDPQSKALIMAPTRELAAQIQEAARSLASGQMGSVLLIGGDPMMKQISNLKRNPRLIIGTPGRFNDHLNRRTLKLHEASFLVLDEVDRMLDMGFSEALKTIMPHLAKERQTFMFSATMAEDIKKLSLTYLKNPQLISVGSTREPVLKIKQETRHTTANEKFPSLLEELGSREGSVIIFVKTKHGADRLAVKLSQQKHPASAIHGDLKQRKRDSVIQDFRKLKTRIMVATDVAARGLDIPHIMHVINYDLPQCPEDYIHRVGRTGRAGMEGFALSFIAPEDNIKWRRIHNLINNKNEPQGDSRSDNPSHKRKKKPRPFDSDKKSRSFGEKKQRAFDSDKKARPFDSEKPRPFDPDRKPRPLGSDKKARPFDSEKPRPFDPDRKSRPFGSEKKARPFDSEKPRPFDSDRKPRPFGSEKKARPFVSAGAIAGKKKPSKNNSWKNQRSAYKG
ncbi:MAG: DEAD/DEAH box helicase, partial [Alphaproteobacteria bacterium]|nr:DEAD/DEAH box helicase [Alphaproteobacteria bacterium]